MNDGAMALRNMNLQEWWELTNTYAPLTPMTQEDTTRFLKKLERGIGQASDAGQAHVANGCKVHWEGLRNLSPKGAGAKISCSAQCASTASCTYCTSSGSNRRRSGPAPEMVMAVCCRRAGHQHSKQARYVLMPSCRDTYVHIFASI
jgi:hypothetical protein